MTANRWLQIATMLAIVFALTKPVGGLPTPLFSREKTLLDPALRPLETFPYRRTAIGETRQMDGKEYTAATLRFSGVSSRPSSVGPAGSDAEASGGTKDGPANTVWAASAACRGGGPGSCG